MQTNSALVVETNNMKNCSDVIQQVQPNSATVIDNDMTKIQGKEQSDTFDMGFITFFPSGGASDDNRFK